MRYRYLGLKRDSADPVRGQIEADNEDQAYDLLGDHGVVVQSLVADPEPTDDSLSPPAISHAIDRALDAGSKPVAFDRLTRRYRGKRVWVIDREKIKQGVMRAVDTAIHQSQTQAESDAATRDRITEAIESLFGDNQNLTSPLSNNQESLEEQIQRLTFVVSEFEGTVRSMQVTPRQSEWLRSTHRTDTHRRSNNAVNPVLRDVLQHNLDLRRRLQEQKSTGRKKKDPAPPPLRNPKNSD